MSALALKKFLPSDGTITTFDIVPWDSLADTFLRPQDFDNHRLEQQIGDLSEPKVFEFHRRLIQETELLFMDGPRTTYLNASFFDNWNRFLFKNHFSSCSTNKVYGDTPNRLPFRELEEALGK